MPQADGTPRERAMLLGHVCSCQARLEGARNAEAGGQAEGEVRGRARRMPGPEGPECQSSRLTV